MVNKTNISQYRERLDKTLACDDLTNEKTIKSLLKNQLLHSAKNETEVDIENILGTKTKEVSNFLDMLRSASENDETLSKTHDRSQPEWKLKQDSEEFRVMYREGIQGSPFHTLLVEGYVDGPVDACLCVSWETYLYKKWWPQYNVPSFKIISCQCLKKVRIGEHISLMRVKSWPLSTREALLHYFAFEYFQDGLIIILVNTISDLKSIDQSSHGFSIDGIPEAQDMVRIDVVGGFAIQKVTQDRSYFRTIANMDMKLDLVPPAFINFISRQLIGSGFKLYQKAIASVAKSDEDFSKTLNDPLYERIRKSLYSSQKNNDIFENYALPEVRQVEMSLVNDILLSESPPKIDQNFSINNEIKEEEEEDLKEREHVEGSTNNSSILPVTNSHVDEKWNFCLSPEVTQALGTLDKVISMVREKGNNVQTRPFSGFTIERLNLEQSIIVEASNHPHKSINGSANCNSRGTGGGLNSGMRDDVNHNKITAPSDTSVTSTYNNKQDDATIEVNVDNLTQPKKSKPHKNKRLCCFYSFPGK